MVDLQICIISKPYHTLCWHYTEKVVNDTISAFAATTTVWRVTFKGENFCDLAEIRFSRRKLLTGVAAKRCHAPPILWRKLSWIAVKPQISRKFSPSKVSRYMVLQLTHCCCYHSHQPHQTPLFMTNIQYLGMLCHVLDLSTLASFQHCQHFSPTSSSSIIKHKILTTVLCTYCGYLTNWCDLSHSHTYLLIATVATSRFGTMKQLCMVGNRQINLELFEWANGLHFSVTSDFCSWLCIPCSSLLALSQIRVVSVN